MVRVAVPAATPVMLTGVVEPKLKVGRFTAPVGLDVTAAVSATLPVKPPAGVTVMAEVFPVVAPGARVTLVPARVKPGAGTVSTDVLLVIPSRLAVMFVLPGATAVARPPEPIIATPIFDDAQTAELVRFSVLLSL
jgi:hypothetical protein